jgi:hypothetical protein
VGRFRTIDLRKISHEFGLQVMGEESHRELKSREILTCLEVAPGTCLEVTWLKHKGECKDPLAHFEVSRVEGVRGTHKRKHEVMKSETPFQDKSMVMLVVTWK